MDRYRPEPLAREELGHEVGVALGDAEADGPLAAQLPVLLQGVPGPRPRRHAPVQRLGGRRATGERS
jgi:hypothetical protein